MIRATGRRNREVASERVTDRAERFDRGADHPAGLCRRARVDGRVPRGGLSRRALAPPAMSAFEWISVAQTVLIFVIGAFVWSARAGLAAHQLVSEMMLLKDQYARLEQRFDRAGQASSDLGDQIQTLMGDLRSVRDVLTVRLDTAKADYARVDRQLDQLMQIVTEHSQRMNRAHRE